MDMTNYAAKAANRVALNRSLLSVAFGILFLMITLKEELLLEKILSFQLVLSIPLFITSIMAYSKIGYRPRVRRWNNIGWITFLLGYTFLINIIGIIVGKLSGKGIALLLFGVSWILATIYSAVDISYDKKTINERLVKEGLFILIQVLGGVLVVLGFY